VLAPPSTIFWTRARREIGLVPSSGQLKAQLSLGSSGANLGTIYANCDNLSIPIDARSRRRSPRKTSYLSIISSSLYGTLDITSLDGGSNCLEGNNWLLLAYSHDLNQIQTPCLTRHPQTPHKAYPSVDGPRYALWEVMRYERSILV